MGWIRRNLVSRPVFRALRHGVELPRISETERVALKAGDVGVEQELFCGRPDFARMLSQPYPKLTAEEKAFLEGPVEDLCAAVNDWEVWKNRELPEAAWDLIRQERFFGLIIPKTYGGLGFSAAAHSEIISKLSSRSLPLGITVMVPNSLGPAELLIHYGTEEQKRYFLPRLARGEEIPAFALTEPHAGSDAAAIRSQGTVFRGGDGKLYLRLDWNKRWITLGGICTILGLAFRLRDPENLLGKGEDVGITCALVPVRTPGVTVGRRHDPLGVPFVNSPTQGEDVVLPVEAIIGGAFQAGNGWRMLMESLAAGRGISLPAQSVGSAKVSARIASAHAVIRKQFGLPIGRFDALSEPLARIGGSVYLMDAGRKYALGALDAGVRPPIVTAILKYQTTELNRRVTIDAMDVLGGAGISLGPNNLLAHTYIASPISITVEGANILTRTLMIFGQGALRAHPFALGELEALRGDDLADFDRVFWSHVGYVTGNSFRAFALSLSRGWLGREAFQGEYRRRLAWSSALFAALTDLAMGVRGARLKTEGRLTGRFADVLSWMYLATAVLRRYEAEGRRKEDLPLVEWSLEYSLSRIQEAFEGILSNLRAPWVVRAGLRAARWWLRLNPVGVAPSDRLNSKVTRLLLTPGAARDRLLGGVYVPMEPEERLGELESVFRLAVQGEAILERVRGAVRDKRLPKIALPELLSAAVLKGVITAQERQLLDRVEKARDAAIQVDDFSAEEYFKNRTGPLPAKGARPGVRFSA